LDNLACFAEEPSIGRGFVVGEDGDMAERAMAWK
jgi:hypothetical protein